ncbi:MAG: hypothetical protein E5V67_02495 [Mesorhizobium sp.]|nr:MAG: hypothetical protein E5X10_00965 [Mesorhizobium sp.]TIU13494.1 MAG: hypothetical protein E5W44_03200 [Mesorhizobium sp.]TIU88491.1 MAG: hypothetical protein E5W06_01750 [Mesorhizobium sp.]TKB44160.1 MAG: hypothetical protein E5V67_02495 [Mesorhizobium sp.]
MGELMLRPKQKPPKVYSNADRFGEDGRRLYSAYAATLRKGRRKSLMIPVVDLLAGALAAAMVLALVYLVAF